MLKHFAGEIPPVSAGRPPAPRARSPLEPASSETIDCCTEYLGCITWQIIARSSYQYVPHKAVAEVSKIANYRTLVAVNHGSQSTSADGSKSGWRRGSVVVVVLVIVVAM